MRRRHFTLASFFSLLLCLTTLAVWARSFWRHDEVSFSSTRLTKSGWVGNVETLHSHHGELFWGHLRYDFLPGHQPPDYYRGRIRGPNWASSPARQSRIDLRGQPLGWAGVGVVTLTGADSDATYLRTDVVIPHWLLALATALLPGRLLIRYGRYRYRKSFRPGVCRSCGYDIRATPDRCPECGTAVAGTGSSAQLRAFML